MAIETWPALLAAYEKLRESSDACWVFRGQRDSQWKLRSALERAVSERFQRPMASVGDFEQRLSREFRRHHYRYSTHQPDGGDLVEWLSIMQHHGAPTRLLDFTYSFWVALYFAIEDAVPGTTCALWAVDSVKCSQLLKDALPDLAAAFARDGTRAAAGAQVLGSGKLLVCVVNPFFLNERLTVQQGVFLAPCNPCASFMENFDASIGKHSSAWAKLEIDCSVKVLTETLRQLRRMNVTRAALFPGLDGFATSLENLIPLDEFWAGA